MKTNLNPFLIFRKMPRLAVVMAITAMLGVNGVRASVAYGDINNFDTVNDTGTSCHGFEIELEDTRSTDITYTYDWNHYGTPVISEDTASRPGHTNTYIRYCAKYDPLTGLWSAYTAVPTNAIAPTDGHMFTDPSVNFGGEHFGVGYFNQPTAIHYHWLQDDGTGNLVLGPQVQVATPTFVYSPPVAAAPGIPPVPPRVQAAIKPPPAPVVQVGPAKEFGAPVWVKEIRTTSHNTNSIKLRDLVSDNPHDAREKNWRNGEPDEVETEWQLLQTEFRKANGGVNGELAAAPEDLGNANEVVTRRYEFFKYLGPIDAETGEAKADGVGPDGIHGNKQYTNTVVVGNYLGAQMSALAVEAPLGMIDHLNDGETGVPYVARTVVIGGSRPFVVTNSGALPPGMAFDAVAGVLSGTPETNGVFTYTIGANDGVTAIVKTYLLTIAGSGEVLPAQHLVEVFVGQGGGGSASGAGLFVNGSLVNVTATPANGFAFLNWTENGHVVGTDEKYAFPLNANRSLTANFFAGNVIHGSASPPRGGTVVGGGGYAFGVNSNITLTAAANAGYAFVNWTENGGEVSTNLSCVINTATNHTLVAHFLGDAIVNASVDVPGGGSVLGAGRYGTGEAVALTAVENPGYWFWGWTVASGDIVSYDYMFTLIAEGETNVIANFYPVVNLTLAALPDNGGVCHGDGVYWFGDTAFIEAVPNPGFKFVNWTTNRVLFSSSSTNFVSLDADTTIVAHFAPQDDDRIGNLDFDGHRSRFKFTGTPGAFFVLQRSTDLVNWTSIRTNVVPANGSFSDDDDFHDRGGVAPPSAYYRNIKQ
ncbi:MAG: putative Ig domain-containing protein [Verrucomicrobiota bacterium]